MYGKKVVITGRDVPVSKKQHSQGMGSEGPIADTEHVYLFYGSHASQSNIPFYHVHRPMQVKHTLTMGDQVGLVETILKDGRINAVGCRIPLESNWNLNLLESLCTPASDREVLTYLRFGWPINRDESPVTCTWENHGSALQHEEQVTKHIMKELRYNTLLGPFVTSPFGEKITGISPMSTRPKKGTQNRRIIVDLSWPVNGNSVNSGIPKDSFMGVPSKLRYPTIDGLCRRVFRLRKESNKPIFGWKKDMERAFKQIPLEPSSWPKMGICWLSAIFFDKTAVMGCRSAPYMCQRTTNVIRHIMANLTYIIFNYVDDFMSIDYYWRACRSYV